MFGKEEQNNTKTTSLPEPNGPGSDKPANNNGSHTMSPAYTSDSPSTAPPSSSPSRPHADDLLSGTGSGSDDLLSIKQEALQQLSPLVSHLDQTPEEKFKTTMMMIQASDDHSLIKSAHEAAKQITNEKARAQALLDIVNEINYFTQNNQ